jgi:competence protein ComFC
VKIKTASECFLCSELGTQNSELIFVYTLSPYSLQYRLMKFATEATYYKEALIRLVYPAYCGVCNTFLELQEDGLCSTCSAKLGSLLFSLEDAAFNPKSEHLDEAWSLYPYESPAKEILAAIKFLRKRWLVRVFEKEISRLFEALQAESSFDALLPVPIDREKLMEREFNQTALIANLLKNQIKDIQPDILKKRHSTPAQSSLGRKEREVNLYGAFELKNPKLIRGRNILLIDDIYTTGATADTLAQLLKSHGANKVSLLTLARTELR